MARRKRTSEGIKAAKAKRQAEKRRTTAEALTYDRKHNARPTPERLRHGMFELRDTEDAGVRYAVDAASTTLDRLHMAGRITGEQCQAGHDFAALMARTRLVSAGRSCIDFSPVGHDGDIEHPQEARDEEERRELHRSMHSRAWRELVNVCCEDARARDLQALREGLAVCVDWWA